MNRVPVELIPIHEGEAIAWTRADLATFLSETDPATLPNANPESRQSAGGMTPAERTWSGFIAHLPQQPDREGHYILRAYNIPNNLPCLGIPSPAAEPATNLALHYEAELTRLDSIAAGYGHQLVLPHSTFLSPNNPYLKAISSEQAFARRMVAYTVVPMVDQGLHFGERLGDPNLQDTQLNICASLLEYFDQAESPLGDISAPDHYSYPHGFLYDYGFQRAHWDEERGEEITHIAEWLTGLLPSTRKEALISQATELLLRFPPDSDE